MAAGMEMGGRHQRSRTCNVSKALHEIGNLSRRTLTRGMHPDFETRYVDYFITKLSYCLPIYIGN